MADMQQTRIFSAEQVTVPEGLPEILKAYSKEVISKNPVDVIRFSREYFTKKHAE